MTDVFTNEKRSRIMAGIHGKDTVPEMIVRRLVHSLRYRYRLHVRDLPGNPDLVFPKHKKIIFVHGCFWHRHRCRKGRSLPQTRTEFWEDKLTRNKQRDERNRLALRRGGWKVLVVWECQTSPGRMSRLEVRIRRFLAA